MSRRKIIVNILILCLLACIAVGAFIMARHARASVMIGQGVEKRTFDGNDYYIYLASYEGDYDMQCLTVSGGFLDGIDVRGQMDFEQYRAYCERYGLHQKYTDPGLHYLVCGVRAGPPCTKADLAEVVYRDDAAEFYILSQFPGMAADVSAFVCIVPTQADVKTFRLVDLYSEEQYRNVTRFGNSR